MKKGCFIKSIVILTIFTAVILYIVKHKFNDFVLKPGKSVLSTFVMNEFDKKFDYVKESPQKDSLKVLLKNYISSVNNFKDNSHDSMNSFIDSLKSAVTDSVISNVELKKLKSLIQKQSLLNERSKKN